MSSGEVVFISWLILDKIPKPFDCLSIADRQSPILFAPLTASLPFILFVEKPESFDRLRTPLLGSAHHYSQFD